MVRVAAGQLSLFDLGLLDAAVPSCPVGREKVSSVSPQAWEKAGEELVARAVGIGGWEAVPDGYRAVFHSRRAGPGGVRARVEVSRSWDDDSLFLAACLERGEAVMEYSVWTATVLDGVVLGRVVERALRHCAAWNRVLAGRALAMFGDDAVRLAGELAEASGARSQLEFVVFRDFDLRKPAYEGGRPEWSEAEAWQRGLRTDLLAREAPSVLRFLRAEAGGGPVLVLEDGARAKWRGHFLSQLVLGACAVALGCLPPLPSWPFWDEGGVELPGGDVLCAPFRPQATVGEAIASLPEPQSREHREERICSPWVARVWVPAEVVKERGEAV